MCNAGALCEAAANALGPCAPAAATPAPGPDPGPDRLVTRFEDDARGASALAEAVGTAAGRWGIRWVASRVARLAYAQAAWLLTHEHPVGTHLYLHTEYEPVRRVLTITVGDPGGVLPTHPLGDHWRRSLSGPIHADAYHHGGEGRRLRCQLKVRAPWRVRITWDAERIQGTHPRHTFEDCHSREALRTALARVGRLEAVRAIHVQGPADRDDEWHEPPEE